LRRIAKRYASLVGAPLKDPSPGGEFAGKGRADEWQGQRSARIGALENATPQAYWRSRSFSDPVWGGIARLLPTFVSINTQLKRYPQTIEK
jgi:hypothetical protein